MSWLCLFSLSGTHSGDAASPLADAQAQVTRQSLVGRWVASVGQERIDLRLTREGAFVLGDVRGTYAVEGNSLTLQTTDGETTYQFRLSAEQLTLSGADLIQEIVFSRQQQVADRSLWPVEFSPRSAARKLYSIFVILIILVVAELLIRLLKRFARFFIFSDWGPLRLLYRTRKNRALTVHSLVLNVTKYVVYFVALGFILSELGINYTIYLASLSVVGLAIGFGSQGLVQDMVTGFFIIFESQYDVGDMVEISGQVGIVEDLGLRMTRLSNYLGQTIVIPNRNIAIVGNFAKGAQHARIDVAIAPEAVGCAARLLQEIGDEIARQFPGVVLSRPEVEEPLALKTNEQFVRLALEIWPQQQWLVEQQLVARIREGFKREGLEIPNNRVVAFYHARERRQVPAFGWPGGETVSR